MGSPDRGRAMKEYLAATYSERRKHDPAFYLETQKATAGFRTLCSYGLPLWVLDFCTTQIINACIKGTLYG